MPITTCNVNGTTMSDLPEPDGVLEWWTDEYRVWIHPVSHRICVRSQGSLEPDQARGLASFLNAAAQELEDGGA